MGEAGSRRPSQAVRETGGFPFFAGSQGTAYFNTFAGIIQRQEKIFSSEAGSFSKAVPNRPLRESTLGRTKIARRAGQEMRQQKPCLTTALRHAR